MEGSLTRAWETLDSVATAAGSLELRCRGKGDFLILVDGRVLMTSRAHRSEERLAECACAALAGVANPRVLIGGLGMGYTLRAALDRLGAQAQVVVAELEPAVVGWCEGPLAALTENATGDPRVELRVADVGRVIAEAANPGGGGGYDAIALDLFEGPRGDRAEAGDSLYGDAAVRRASQALRPGGVLAVWSEEPAPGFARRLQAAGLDVQSERAGRGGRRHAIHVGRRPVS